MHVLVSCPLSITTMSPIPSNIVRMTNVSRRADERTIRNFFGNFQLAAEHGVSILQDGVVFVAFASVAIANQALSMNGNGIYGRPVGLDIVSMSEAEQMRHVFRGFFCVPCPLNAYQASFLAWRIANLNANLNGPNGASNGSIFGGNNNMASNNNFMSGRSTTASLGIDGLSITGFHPEGLLRAFNELALNSRTAHQNGHSGFMPPPPPPPPVSNYEPFPFRMAPAPGNRNFDDDRGWNRVAAPAAAALAASAVYNPPVQRNGFQDYGEPNTGGQESNGNVNQPRS